MFIAELSILGSFLCFLFLFIKKAWPLLISSIDNHIEKVKAQIASAEKLKEESSVSLSQANQLSSKVQEEIEQFKKRSEARIAQLEEDNVKYLQSLREEAEASLNAQLKAELSKHKEILIDRLADLVIEKLTEKIKDQPEQITFSKEDLKKLVS